MKAAILRDHHPESSEKWEIACKKKGLEYLAVDMLRADWLDRIVSFAPAFCLSRPPGDLQQNKKIYDEKIFYLEHFTPYLVFPGFLETWIYENKASLAWFLKTNKFPHPSTFVSSDYDEALEFAQQTLYPVVAKTLIGASGSGVRMIESNLQAKAYIRKAFTAGIKRRFGPNRKTGNPGTWMAKAVKSPQYFFKKLRQYSERNQDVQKGIVFFQEYIPHEFEWRSVKIGDSYFAYKKLKTGDQASGSKVFEYGPPPERLLNFTKDLCAFHKFHFMALDLFEHHGGFLVNELQTIFGHKNPYICKVNDQPGRYVFKDNQWVFEPGDFNTNESYDLRLETALELYEKDGS